MAGSRFAASLSLGTTLPALSRANPEFGLLALRQKVNGWLRGQGLQHFGSGCPMLGRCSLPCARSVSLYYDDPAEAGAQSTPRDNRVTL
jgi:hypothetical protein